MLNSSAQPTTAPRTVLVVEDEPTLATAIAQRITAQAGAHMRMHRIPDNSPIKTVQKRCQVQFAVCAVDLRHIA